MAEGDFTRTLDIDQKDEIGTLAASLNEMVGKLRDVVAEVQSASENVASGSEELSASAQSMEGAVWSLTLFAGLFALPGVTALGRWALVRRVSLLSYGIYLCHQPLLSFCDPLTRGLASWPWPRLALIGLLAGAASLAAAMLLERGAAWLSGRLQPRAAPQPGPALEPDEVDPGQKQECTAKALEIERNVGIAEQPEVVEQQGGGHLAGQDQGHHGYVLQRFQKRVHSLVRRLQNFPDEDPGRQCR